MQFSPTDIIQFIGAVGVIIAAYLKNRADMAALSARLDAAFARIVELEKENELLQTENAGLRSRVDDLTERLIRASRGSIF